MSEIKKVLEELLPLSDIQRAYGSLKEILTQRTTVSAGDIIELDYTIYPLGRSLADIKQKIIEKQKESKDPIFDKLELRSAWWRPGTIKTTLTLQYKVISNPGIPLVLIIKAVTAVLLAILTVAIFTEARKVIIEAPPVISEAIRDAAFPLTALLLGVIILVLLLK